jgi:hypothetical protein
MADRCFKAPYRYRLEDLMAFVESLSGWYDSTGEKSAKVVEKGKP